MYQGRVVYALCDRELIGRVLKEGKITLDLDKYRSFYVGEDDFGNDFESVNAIGVKSIQFLIEKGIIKRENVRFVEGIPHVQVYRI